MSEPTEYLLGSSLGERERLLRQCELHEPEARWVLDQVGVQRGWRALDVGCGPLGILDLLSKRVGPTGVAVGLDNEPRMLEWARLSLEERRLSNVELALGEAAASGLTKDSFDLAHARLILINVPHPEDVLREMVALVRPGGGVAVQEVDWISWTCEPPHPAWDQLLSAITAVRRAVGLDTFIGRRLPGMLRAAGLVDVGVKAFAPVWRPGDLYQNLLVVFAGIHKDKIVAAGLLRAEEVDVLAEALRVHLAHPDTIVVYSLLFQAWGRKPALER